MRVIDLILMLQDVPWDAQVLVIDGEAECSTDTVVVTAVEDCGPCSILISCDPVLGVAPLSEPSR